MKRLLQCVLFILVGAPNVSYATVSKILPKNSVAVVDVDDSTEFSKGDSVCFANDLGKRVGCGKVAKVSKNRIFVRLSKATFEKLTVGMVLMGRPQQSKTQMKKGSSPPLAVRIKFAPQIFSPVAFTTVTSAAPRSTDTSSQNIWKSDASIKQSIVSFEGEVQIPIGGFAITPGFRMKTSSNATVLSDYKSDLVAATDPYLENTITASAIGFWIDFLLFYKSILPSVRIPLSLGLDFEKHSLNFGSQIVTSQGKSDFASANSSTTAASLRLGTGVDLAFLGPVGASLNATVLVPITELSKSYSYSGEAAAVTNGDQADNLNAALNHRKASFGLILGVGLLGSF